MLRLITPLNTENRDTKGQETVRASSPPGMPNELLYQIATDEALPPRDRVALASTCRDFSKTLSPMLNARKMAIMVTSFDTFERAAEFMRVPLTRMEREVRAQPLMALARSVSKVHADKRLNAFLQVLKAIDDQPEERRIDALLSLASLICEHGLNKEHRASALTSLCPAHLDKLPVPARVRLLTALARSIPRLSDTDRMRAFETIFASTGPLPASRRGAILNALSRAINTLHSVDRRVIFERIVKGLGELPAGQRIKIIMELAGAAAHMSPIVEESRHALVQLAPWIPDLPDESRTRLLLTCLANFTIHGGNVGMIYDLLLNELDHDGLPSDELDHYKALEKLTSTDFTLKALKLIPDRFHEHLLSRAAEKSMSIYDHLRPEMVRKILRKALLLEQPARDRVIRTLVEANRLSYRANTVEVFETLFRFIRSLPPRTRDSVLRQVRTLLSTPANLPGETTAEKAFRKEINARDTRPICKLDQAQDGKKVSRCVVS